MGQEHDVQDEVQVEPREAWAERVRAALEITPEEVRLPSSNKPLPPPPPVPTLEARKTGELHLGRASMPPGGSDAPVAIGLEEVLEPPDLMRVRTLQRRRSAIAFGAMALAVGAFALIATVGSSPLSSTVTRRVNAAMPIAVEVEPVEAAPAPAPASFEFPSVAEATPEGAAVGEAERAWKLHRTAADVGWGGLPPTGAPAAKPAKTPAGRQHAPTTSAPATPPAPIGTLTTPPPPPDEGPY